MSGRHHVSRPARFVPTRLNLAVLSLATFGVASLGIAGIAYGSAPKIDASEVSDVSDPTPSRPRAVPATVTPGPVAMLDLVPDDITPYEVTTASEIPGAPITQATTPPTIGAPPPPQTREQTAVPTHSAEPTPDPTSEPTQPAEPTTEPTQPAEPTEEPTPEPTEEPALPTEIIVILP